MPRRALATILLAVLAAIPAMAAGGNPGEAELGLFGGFAYLDDYTAGAGPLEPEDDALFGVRFGMSLGSRWSVEASGQRLSSRTGSAPVRDLDIDSMRLGLTYGYRPGERLRPYLAFGFGREKLRVEGLFEEVDPSTNFGGGLRWYAAGNLGLRLDLRYVRTSSNRLADDTQGNVESSVGLSWSFGGVPPDEDGDGVRDSLDRCPGTTSGVLVAIDGCPVDGDRDGVANGLDRCPGTPRGWPVGADGCATDADRDRVADGEDRCPGTLAGARVDGHGCAIDGDGDGAPDGIDRCPDTPRGLQVDARGCAIDTDADGDGVFDRLDRCPETPAGAGVDPDGCPVLFEPERRALVLEGVSFELASARLTAEARATLDRVADTLKQWPELRVEIAGHTDSSGTSGFNLELSLRRAEAVRAYLIDAGVPSSWLTARGYGESRPVADNDSERGRAKNRRVELRRLD